MPAQILIRPKQEKEIKEVRNILYLIFNTPTSRIENPENMSIKAEEFLRMCADRKAFKREYKEIQGKLNLSNTQYYTMIKKLKGVGLIESGTIQSGEEKFKRIWKPSANFNRFLYKLIDVWEAWM